MAAKTTHPAAVYRKCNQVSQEEIWKERVRKEKIANRNWLVLHIRSLTLLES
jgi:hypothetical protein